MSGDLVRVEWPARWEDGPPDGGYPGRALNAWVYGAIARQDEQAAISLHDRQGAKPVTVALAAARGELRLIATGCGEFASIIERAARGAGERIALNGRWLALGNADIKTRTWGELAGALLLGSGAIPGARMSFLTPTTFHSGGRTMPLPNPMLVFRGLLDRWQSFSPIDLGEGAAAAIDQHLAIARHAIVGDWVRFEGLHAAFHGWADFRLVRPPAEYRGLLALLASFAEFAGVGQKTLMGMGCVRTRIHTPAQRAAV